MNTIQNFVEIVGDDLIRKQAPKHRSKGQIHYNISLKIFRMLFIKTVCVTQEWNV